MKKILILSLILFCTSTYAQYFDWNKVTDTVQEYVSTIAISGFKVSSQGQLILNVKRTDSSAVQNIERLFDTDGNEIDSYSDSTGYKRKSSFDRNGNLMVVLQNDSGYTFTYYRTTDTLSLFLNEFCDVNGDASGNFYVFYRAGTGTDSVLRYDASGNYTNSILFNSVEATLDDFGNIYFITYTNTSGPTTITKVSSNGILLNTFTAPYHDFSVTRNGTVWCMENNQIKGYDSTGQVFSTIPQIQGTVQSIAGDIYNDLYVWHGVTLEKYHSNALLWKARIEASGVTKIEIDDSLDIYYCAFGYSTPDASVDSGYMALNIPPGLFALHDINSSGPREIFSFIGKINHLQPDTFYASINSINGNSSFICSSTPFYFTLYYNNLPLNYINDSVFVELSDTLGQFNSPYIIGKGFAVAVKCTIPDSIPEGNGYRIRARLGNALYYTPVFDSVFTINRTPDAPILLHNNIGGYQACRPFIVTTNPDTGLSYSWMELLNYIMEPWNFDPQQDIVYLNSNTYQLTDSIKNLSVYMVSVTENVTGCSRRSRPSAVHEITPTEFYDLSVQLPDTVRINDEPILFNSGFLTTVSGPGIELLSSYNWRFDPSLAQPGWNVLYMEMTHEGTPCIPYSNYQYIYVDTAANIIVNTIDTLVIPFLQYCMGDTLTLTFQLTDSTIYDSTNVFVAELERHTQINNDIVDKYVVGQSTTTTITCVLPHEGGFPFRLRVRSTQTGELSTENPDGFKYIREGPKIDLINLIDKESTCLPLGTTVTFNTTGNYLHEWFRNDTLISTQSTPDPTYFVFQQGNYKLKVTDNYCTNQIGPINFNASAHLPTISLTTPLGTSVLCDSSPVLLSAHTDSLSFLEWYAGDELIATTGSYDSIYVYEPALYTVKAIYNAGGCYSGIKRILKVYRTPSIDTYISHLQKICVGDSAHLKVSSFGFITRWYNAQGIQIGTGDNIFVHDTGSYHAMAMDTTTGCFSLSDVIHVVYRIPMPAITPSGVVNISTGSMITLSFDNILSCNVQWYRANVPIPGATYDTLMATLAGGYFLAATDTTGCTALSPRVVLRRQYRMNTIPPSQIRQNGNETANAFFNVYPNPNKGSFTIEGINLSSKKLEVRITDVSGRMVHEFARENIIDQYREDVTLENMSSGYYNLQLVNGEEVVIIPLLIN